MKAKEYLQRALNARNRIAALDEQIEDLENEMLRVKRCSSQESVQATQEQDPVGNAVVDALDRIADCESEKAEHLVTIMDAGGAICHVAREACRKVLRARYLRGWEWEDIMADMKFSRSYTFELHRGGLAELDGMFEFCDEGEAIAV